MAKYTQEQVLQWLDQMAIYGMLELTADNMGLALSAMEYIDKPVEFVEEEATLPEGYLTPHFKLSEFTYSETALERGIDNTPGDTEVANLQVVADVLEQVRLLANGKAVTITSGYRCPELNAAVGGASDSAHLHGFAADFIIPDYGSPTEICNAILPYMHDLGIDQLINESNSSGGAWVHIGLCSSNPRCEAMTIGPSGTQIGIV